MLELAAKEEGRRVIEHCLQAICERLSNECVGDVTSGGLPFLKNAGRPFCSHGISPY